MKRLERADLLSLETYAEQRSAFRARVLAHKQNRRVQLGEHLVLLFEDRMTIQYQIQEMLRIERIFERKGIEAELDAYNPLIPDGGNFKATLQIEYDDVEERKSALIKLKGIESSIWVRVDDNEPVFAVADEDLERANDVKTSAVHFLRFELGATNVAALKQGGSLAIGCEHEHYKHAVEPVPDAVRASLSADLD
jgi:hypothetical protein